MSIIELIFALVFIPKAYAIVCADGYSCYEQTDSLVWVIQDSGNVNGPGCQNVCEHALCGSGYFHSCDSKRPTLKKEADFSPIATGFGFTCKKGRCWASKSWDGQVWVSINTNSAGKRSCYFPKTDHFKCNADPGNANCFGERYSLVCPCAPKGLEEACSWSTPHHAPAIPTFPTNSNGKSCLDRINYWRKRACDEGWPECPPCGLPPMTECVGCHECANSQAEYDHQHGAHKSFKRCGEHLQGEGGGSSCASVIDSFIRERKVFPDSNGQKLCRGHCGPILGKGCRTFFWGRAKKSGFHTLNWKSCNTNKCDKYCDSHQGQCFRHADSPFVEKPSPSFSCSASISLLIVAWFIMF